MRFYGQFNPPVDQLIYQSMQEFDYVPQGIAVEAGAFDGITESNCKFFEESLGWLILNVEPSPPVYRELIKNRPLSININVALADKFGSANFVHAVHPIHGELFGNGSLEHTEIHLNHLQQNRCEFQNFEVPVSTLQAVMEEADIFDCDLLSLDVEGGELNVLSGIGSWTVKPAFICVEDGWDSQGEIRQLLEKSEYQWSRKIHNNSLYHRRDIFKKNQKNQIDVAGKLAIVTLQRLNSLEVKPFYYQLASMVDDFNFLIVVHDAEIGAADVDIPEILKEKILFVSEVAADSSENRSMSVRAKSWAANANLGLREALSLGVEHVMFLESDLCFPFDLITQLKSDCDGATAPLIWLGNQFYDTWAFQKDGDSISTTKATALKFDANSSAESVGSCVMFNARALGFFRMPYRYENGLIKGLTKLMSDSGVDVQIKPSVCVIHPTTSWKRQVWKINEVVLNKSKRFAIDCTIAGPYSEFVDPVINHICGELRLDPCESQFDVDRASRCITLRIDQSASL
jgi:FkbM family methyltransferase